MKQISVTRDPEGNSGLMLLSIADIRYLEYVRVYNKVAFHTEDATYYCAGTMEYWTHVFNSSGFVFRDVDRNNAVNVEKIRRIDTKLLVAYFERFKTVSEQRCTMSKAKYKVFINEFPLSDETVLLPLRG